MPTALTPALSPPCADGITLTRDGCWRSAEEFVPSTSPTYLDDLVAALDKLDILPSLTSRLLQRERALLYQYHPYLFTAPPNAYSYPSPPPSSSPSAASSSSLPSSSSDSPLFPSPGPRSGIYPVSATRDCASLASASSSSSSQSGRPPSPPAACSCPLPTSSTSPRRKRDSSSSSKPRYHPYDDHPSTRPMLRPASFDQPPSPSSSMPSSRYPSPSPPPTLPQVKTSSAAAMKIVTYDAGSLHEIKPRAPRNRTFRNAAMRFAELAADECVYYFDKEEAVCTACMIPIKLCGKGKYYDTNWRRHKQKCRGIDEHGRLIRNTATSAADASNGGAGSQSSSAAVNVTQYPAPL